MAFSYDECYILIFVTEEGSPWEEALFIYVLDSKNYNKKPSLLHLGTYFISTPNFI
jgi:hypothetical protein